MCKYQVDPTSIVEDTDGRTDKVKPVYHPFIFVEAKGIMMVSLLTHICVTRPEWVDVYPPPSSSGATMRSMTESITRMRTNNTTIMKRSTTNRGPISWDISYANGNWHEQCIQPQNWFHTIMQNKTQRRRCWSDLLVSCAMVKVKRNFVLHICLRNMKLVHTTNGEFSGDGNSHSSGQRQVYDTIRLMCVHKTLQIIYEYKLIKWSIYMIHKVSYIIIMIIYIDGLVHDTLQ